VAVGVVEGRKGNSQPYILGFGLEGRGGRCESLICRSTASNGWQDDGPNSARAGCGAGPLRNSLSRATWTCSRHRSLFAESLTLDREFFS
jgi:hypothetical protein